MAKKGALNGEEYKTIRETLGFSLAEAAEFHKVESINTIKRWEQGESLPTEKACKKILELFEKINFVISEGLERYKQSPKNSEVVLILYPDECYKKFVVGIGDLPNSIHQTMIKRLYTALKTLNAEARLVLFNPQDYFMFLAQKGLKDSQDVRSLWATDYINRVRVN
jgi:transcriptional regulator with XRE-family HTH domain